MKLTTHFRPVSRLRASGAFNLYAFTACTRTSLQISYFHIGPNLSHINLEIRTAATFATKKAKNINPVFAGMSVVHAHARILVPFTNGSRSTPMKPKGTEKVRTAAKKLS